jgi:dihydroflavonol-4-reductase
MIKKVFVTGPDGFLGSHIVNLLLEKGYQVKAFALPGKEGAMASHPEVEIATGNVLDKVDCYRAVQGVDAVIHTAASTKTWPERSKMITNINYKGTLNMVKAAQHENVKRFVHIGSANMFKPGTLEKPGNELRKYVDGVFGLDYIDSKYKTHKKLILMAVRDGFPIVEVCPTFMIGPNDHYLGTSRLVLALMKHQLPFVTHGGKCFVYVNDVATAAVNALTMGRAGEAYIAGNANLTYKAFAQKVASISGVEPPEFVLPTPLLITYGRVMGWLGKTFGFTPMLSLGTAKVAADDQYFCSQKAVSELDMPQTDIDEAIRLACNWLRENGYA